MCVCDTCHRFHADHDHGTIRNNNEQSDDFVSQVRRLSAPGTVHHRYYRRLSPGNCCKKKKPARRGNCLHTPRTSSFGAVLGSPLQASRKNNTAKQDTNLWRSTPRLSAMSYQVHLVHRGRSPSPVLWFYVKQKTWPMVPGGPGTPNGLRDLPGFASWKAFRCCVV